MQTTCKVIFFLYFYEQNNLRRKNLENIFYDDEVIGRVQIRKSKKANRIGLCVRDSNVILVVPEKLPAKSGQCFFV